MYKQVNNENEIEKQERQRVWKLIEGKNYIFELICTEKTRKFSLELINFSKNKTQLTLTGHLIGQVKKSTGRMPWH